MNRKGVDGPIPISAKKIRISELTSNTGRNFVLAVRDFELIDRDSNGVR